MKQGFKSYKEYLDTLEKLIEGGKMIKISHICQRCKKEFSKEFDDSELDNIYMAHDYLDKGSYRGLCEMCEVGFKELRDKLQAYRNDELDRYLEGNNGR